jgi:DNA-directed RNA polymerase specialized sigma24 family protein
VKHERIAEMLGIEAGAVKVRIHRALKELRQIFVELPDGNAPWDVKRSGRTLQII